MHPDIFISSTINRIFVKSSSCIFCCFQMDVKCITAKNCALSCKRMLIDFSVAIVGIISSVLGILLNVTVLLIIRLGRHSKYSVQFCFKSMSKYMAVFHGINCLTIALITTADIHFSVDFAFVEYTWPQNSLCLSIYFFTLLNYVSSAFLVSCVALARLMIVYYPLNSKFMNKTFVNNLLLTSVLIVTFLSTFLSHHRHKYLYQTKNRLCSPLDIEAAGNISLLISSILIISVGLISIFCVLIFYILLVIELKKPLRVGVEKLRKAVVVNILLACGSHLCTWVPMCIVLLLSLFSYDMSEKILVWTVVAITPINSFIYPILLR